MLPGTWRVDVSRSTSSSAALNISVTTPRASLSPAVTVRLHRFTDLASYLGQQVTVTERDGSASSGTLTRVNEQRLWLEMTMGSGRAEINLREDSVRELMLADGTRLVLDTAGGGETAAKVTTTRGVVDESDEAREGPFAKASVGVETIGEAGASKTKKKK